MKTCEMCCSYLAALPEVWRGYSSSEICCWYVLLAVDLSMSDSMLFTNLLSLFGKRKHTAASDVGQHYDSAINLN